jgi:hypothetical protein
MRHIIISDDCQKAATCSGIFAMARSAEKRGLDNHTGRQLLSERWHKIVSRVFSSRPLWRILRRQWRGVNKAFPRQSCEGCGPNDYLPDHSITF